jgi:aldose sugar dehydrogenase
MSRRVLIIALMLVALGFGAWLVTSGAIWGWWNNSANNSESSVTADDITVEVVADNLTAPWSIDFAENGDIFFTERPGRVRLITDGQLTEDVLLELPDAPSEGGTLGIALDPEFTDNNYVYLYYTASRDQNRISRYTYEDRRLTEETILIDSIPADPIHNGGRLAFGPDNKLYAGTGDAGDTALPQDRDSLAGKILRINPDGSIPEDNPFEDSYVFSLGHRNVQGLDWNEDGELYATEHGPNARDEVNKIEAGANYGWPELVGTEEFNPEERPGIANYRNPAIDSGSNTWAPSGATFYTGDTLPEDWHGKFIFAGLRSQALWRYDTETGNLDNVFNGEYGRLRDVQQAPDGTLYILTSNQDGRGSPAANDDRILRIIPE